VGKLELVDGLGLGEHVRDIIMEGEERVVTRYHGVAVVGGILYLAEYPALDIKILNCKRVWQKKDNKTFIWDPQTIGISYSSL
jgi:hypothetical protein